jgi:predicted nucleic acid-binding protein
MTPVFADTSFYVALLSPRDVWHARATTISQKIDREVVLTDFVLLEVANMYSATPRRDGIAAFILALRRDPSATVVEATRDLLDRGLFVEWSLTDCTSFVVMQEMGVTEALSSDHHFEQAGFSILLK